MFAENIKLTERLASHGFRHEDSGNRWVGGIHRIIRIDSGEVIGEMDCFEAAAFCKGIEFAKMRADA